jgi:hypothetical protein
VVAPPPAPVIAVRPPPPAPVPTVRLRIRTEPETASLSMDGTRIANPFDSSVNRARGDHRIVATAEGYEAQTQTVAFDRDRTVTIRLRRAAPPRERAGRGGRGGSPSAMSSTTMAPTSMATTMASTMRSVGFVSDNPY